MTFGGHGKDDDPGSFSVSPATIVNTVAALALAAMASTVFLDHSDITYLKDHDSQRIDEIRRIEAQLGPINTTIVGLLGAVQGLKDSTDAGIAARRDLKDQLRELQKSVSDLDLIIRPPRVDRSGH